MLSTDQAQEQPGTHSTPTFVRWMRGTYVLVAGLFVAAIALQVFFAGAAALVHPRFIVMHTTFGHVLEFFPMALMLLSLGGRLSWRLIGFTALTFVLYALQYVFLWVVPSFGIPALRALHAVNALVLFWLALYLAQSVWRLRLSRSQSIRQPSLTAT